MKKLKLFFASFAMLALGVGNAWAEEVTINFGSGTGDVTINDFNISTTDSYGTTWSITTVASDKSFTQKGDYSQIGASKKPATSITLTGTIPQACTINSIKAKWGGFSGTAGQIAITINGNSYASGKLNATSDVTVSAIDDVAVSAGDKIVISVTSISKGVKLYSLSYTYTESSGGGEPETPVVTIELDKTEATLNLEETLTLNATVENSEETIVWASDKESVATVSNGVVTAIGAGKANITATVEGVTATCVVTVKDPNAPAWTLVTNASTLKAGDKIVIAGTGDNSNYALSTEQKSNNRGAVAATKTEDKIEEVDNMQILTLETGTKTGTFAFNTGSGYLYAASSSSNQLKTQTTNNDNGSWTIAIADGVATVVAQGTNTRNTMRYNYNNGSPLFAAYASSSTTGALVAIYTQAKPAGTPDAPTLTASQEFETETFTVEISAVDGATIHYTLDESDPTEASTTYSAPFTVNATTTVKAIAVKDGVASNVATATYTKVSVIEKTCAEAAALCTSDESTDKYRVEGYVTAIETAYSAQYNNITVWMADTRNGGKVLQAFRATPTVDADKAVKVGDKIKVVGNLKLYNSVHEIVSGTYTITQLDPVYNVNITSAHGTVTATPASAVEGTEITLSVEVESGWVFQSWTVTDASSNTIEVTENKFKMPASDVYVVANYTESVADDAVLILMANTQEHSKNTYKVGETVELPDNIANDCVKMFVGWSADANRATAPEYAPGADFELTAAEHTLYAVYATETAGATNTTTISVQTYATANSWENGEQYLEIKDDDVTISVTGGGNTGKYYTSGNQWRLYQGESATITVTIPENLSLSTIKFTYVVNTGGVLLNGTTQIKSNDLVSVSGSSATFSVGNTGTATNGQVRITAIEVVYNSAPTYSDYSTTCVGALAAPTFSVAEGTYTEAQSITLSAAEGTTIYYTLDGTTTPTASSEKYTTPIAIDECGTTIIKAIAISSESESPVASATYTINLPITNTEATAYTPAEAIAIIDGACDKTEEVYVKGVVVSTSGLNTEYGNYDNVVVKAIDDESATPTKFTFFRLFKAAEKTKFTASDEVIGVGDIITAKGKLTKYNSTYELAEGCYLVSRVANVKLDAKLAWNPETVTLTVGDAFTAPTLVNTYSVTGISYESSNDEVATVTTAGVIALGSATGTATITATFAGDDEYKAAEVSCTIKVKAIPEDCEGSDDFATDESESPLSYLERTTAAGWKATNAARVTIEDETYFAINGKTSAVGTITSPVLNGGIGSIKIRYANTYSENNGVSFRLDIKQNGEVVETYTITKSNADVVKGTVYTELIENINVAGEFQMVFTNLSPSESTSNKDRVSIGHLCWTGYEEVVTPDTYTRDELTPGNYYTICMTKAMKEIQGATLWSFCGKDANFAYLVQEDAPYTAGKAYIMYAEAETVSAILTGDEVPTPVANGAIHGTFADMYQDDLNVAGDNIYLVIGNQLRRVDGQAGNSLPANRAYVDIDEITGGAPAGIPANRVRSMPMQPQVATGMENVDASAQPVKTIINGQLYILRGEKMYDAQGKLVK